MTKLTKEQIKNGELTLSGAMAACEKRRLPTSLNRAEMMATLKEADAPVDPPE